jgi:TATA-box binding protein (TBP) (component of TFIID and TFIIIB)
MNIIETPGLPECKVVNVVATYKIGVRLNLKKIVLYYRDIIPAKFNPRRFAAMTINMEGHNMKRTTVLCFASGNVVHTGGETEEHIRLSAHAFVYFLNTRLRIPARVKDFKITNMVCDTNAGFEVDLKALNDACGDLAEYEPELFPACRVRSKDNRNIAALVYLSGGMVLTGLKNRYDVRPFLREIYELCCQHPYSPEGGVSKHEYKLLQVNDIAQKENLRAITNSIKEMSGEKLPDKDLKSIIKQVNKSILGSTRSQKGVLYLRSINPCTPLSITSGMHIPFTPTITV